jgi:hypothetical protein
MEPLPDLLHGCGPFEPVGVDFDSLFPEGVHFFDPRFIKCEVRCRAISSGLSSYHRFAVFLQRESPVPELPGKSGSLIIPFQR